MPPKDHEIRTYTANIEIRSDDQGKRRLIGHAAVFNQIAGDPRIFLEQVAPGAFADTIAKDDIRALFNHDKNYVLGRKNAGTLSLREDDTGLAIEIDPPDAQWARDLMVSIDRGDISQMSFSFRVDNPAQDQSWEIKDGIRHRTLKKVTVRDVGPVAFPFYEGTDIALRSFEEVQEPVKTPRTPLSKRLNPNLKGAPK